MDNKELQKMLNKIEVPEPSNEARARAIALARKEFKNSQQNTKGFAGADRQTSRTNKKWSFDMSKFTMKKLAGTTAIVLAVSVVMTTDYSPFNNTKEGGKEIANVTIDSQIVGNKRKEGGIKQEIVEKEEDNKIVKHDGATLGTALKEVNIRNAAPMVAESAMLAKNMGANQNGNVVGFSDSSSLMASEAISGDYAASSAPMRPVKARNLSVKESKKVKHNYARTRIMPISSSNPVEGGQEWYDSISGQDNEIGNDKFKDLKSNPIKLVKEEPVSTFSIDVDTASYSFARKKLNRGVLPQKDAIRIEELINYFDYDYAIPEDKSEPFQPTISVFETPWNVETKLLHIGIKGYDLSAEEKPRSNLVFLLDVSGSMNATDKLPLLKNSFKMLVENLNDDDIISIVVYAGAAGTVLEPTKVSEKGKIFAALERLSAGGSTAGGEGIRQAYALAEANFDKNGVNRIILATDGDFNVGIRNKNELKNFVERKRNSGVYLSILGFGQGNYNDALMQELAQNGNGNAAYIDSLNEARKVLVDEASGTLFTIAKDVKLQVEFNPDVISEYRLVGYESRMLKREDFNNDAVDAGEIGAGHAVTAIYEITPKGSKARLVDDLKYGDAHEDKPLSKKGKALYGNEYATLEIRYKLPDVDKSTLTSRVITIADDDTRTKIERTVQSLKDINEAKFASAVAAFGQLLKGSSYMGEFSYDDVIELALAAKGDDRFGYRSEFINLVRLAKSASAMRTQPNGQRHLGGYRR